MAYYPNPFDEDEEERRRRLGLAADTATEEITEPKPMSEMSTREAVAAAYDKQHPYGGTATMTGPLGNISYYDEELNKPKEIANQPNTLLQSPPDRKPRYAELGFDGKNLSWIENDEVKKSWPAMSGKPEYQSKEFTFLKNKGPIPEGQWKVNQKQHQNFFKDQDVKSMIAGIAQKGPWPGSIVAWGKDRIWLQPGQETDTLGRTGLSIHGGTFLGSAGCVDLAGNMDDFWEWYRKYGQNMNLNVKYPKNW